MTVNMELFRKSLQEIGMELSAEEEEKFLTYSDLLYQWNQKIDLTAITEPDDVAIKHFFDSAMLLHHYQVKQGARMIDVGTGAGFPAIPCGILRPDLKITLLDSLNKRINFLKAVGESIGYRMDYYHARAEDGGRQKELRERFDIATARAVANLSVLCEYCLPFVKVGGCFLALKGPDGTKELELAQSAIAKLGGETEAVVEYTLPDGGCRTLICIKKISQTPTKYPRTPAKIAKEVL